VRPRSDGWATVWLVLGVVIALVGVLIVIFADPG
jgi:hypothetical protein